MVEPFSVLAISGISAIGGILLGKKSGRPMVVEQVIEQPVEFIALRDNVRSKQLYSYFSKQKPIFINLRKLSLEDDENKQFFRELQAMADECSMKISSVSKTLLYITPLDQKIKIRTLTRIGPTFKVDQTDNGS